MTELTNSLTIATKPVTLNLFQGPSGHKRGAIRRETHPTVWLATTRSGRGAKWTLKQVQGDEFGYGIA